MRFKLAFSKKYGQSTVEYAAALVVAAILIAGILPLSTEGINAYYQNVFNAVTNYIAPEG